MRLRELFRLVWMNVNQNRFKSIMTSIGIVVGAATIVLVIGIGQGGQMEVAEQFAELNAGAIDISYEYEGDEASASGGMGFGGRMGQFFGNMMSGGGKTMSPEMMQGGQMRSGMKNRSDNTGDEQSSENEAGMPQRPGTDSEMPQDLPENAQMPQDPAGTEQNESETQENETEEETSMVEERLNQEQIILTQSDVEDIERYVEGINGAMISFSTRASVEGGNLESSQTYSIAGVKENYLDVSRLEMAEGDFLTEADEEQKSRVCVLGVSAAKEIFGSTEDAAGSSLYLNDRVYQVIGVLKSSQTVSAGISPDTAILIPYETGIKYITGTQISPVITVVAEDVNVLDNVIEDVRTVLEENYVNTRFTFEDSGSKMQAAQSSNRTLTMLLTAMAVIVFFVGGIGIMNVLFVSVKERTNEIGILKAIGTSGRDILTEFLIEAAAISFIGGVLGVVLSFLLIPVAEWLDVRVEAGAAACLAALGFAVLTGTLFGIYPAWKASRLEPVEALNAE